MRRGSASIAVETPSFEMLYDAIEPSPPKLPALRSDALLSISSAQRSHNVSSPRQLQKKRYMHNWENIFGRHTSKCTFKSVITLVQKEGKAVIFLIVLGASVSILDYAINEAIIALKLVQSSFTDITLTAIDSANNPPGLILFITLVWSAIFACLSVAWTRFIDPMAAGSGIPEIKTILSADSRQDPSRYLRSRTLFSKSIGLITAQASGLSVGKEGPFVHTACILSHQFMKHTPFFQRLYRNESLHRHMYNAACAVGVASTFGAPIGGVLFSIEVTSSFFLLSNYWRSFVAAVSGSITKNVLDYITQGQQPGFHSFQALYPTTYRDLSFEQLEMIAFAVLGLLMGLGGAGYVYGATWFRAKFTRFNQFHPLIWGTFITVIVAAIMFCPGPFMRLSIANALADLTSPNSLPTTWAFGNSIIWPLLIYSGARVIVTMMSVALPVPSGDFIPLFSAGAAFGRLYGELLSMCFPELEVVAGGYALVGGAALVAASTQTISVAVIALELTGQFIYFTPLFLAVLLSCGLSKGLSVSIYDSAIISKGLPYLPMLRCNELRTERICARDVMEDDVQFLPNQTTLGEIKHFLQQSQSSVPIVLDRTSRLFAGCVARDEFQIFIAEHESSNDDENILLSACSTLELSGNVLKIDEETPLETIHLLFEMLKCSKLFVTKFGVLQGVVTRASMHHRLRYLSADASQASVIPRDDIVC
ncbi:chloride channel protein 1-like [Thraustotheca clavata]|uniref:Chloride channel protein 1-like n=1 Tax=Thraustotheca clavata TaxID=74557 RepID=A0A1W0A2B5_9STRA|nr:chloride channel protein 1-like [Thraustotheca clavata]